MSKFNYATVFIINFVFAGLLFGDLGGDRLIANTPGRCWKVVHRDFDIKGNLVAGYGFVLVNVGGTGETDDQITFELTVKENFVLDVGWDESKTKVYTGTGLIKSISQGKVRFEIYIDAESGNQTYTVQGYYHPGSGTSDFDDRIVMSLPAQIAPTNENDCDEDSFGEGSGLGGL